MNSIIFMNAKYKHKNKPWSDAHKILLSNAPKIPPYLWEKDSSEGVCYGRIDPDHIELHRSLLLVHIDHLHLEVLWTNKKLNLSLSC